MLFRSIVIRFWEYELQAQCHAGLRCRLAEKTAGWESKAVSETGIPIRKCQFGNANPEMIEACRVGLIEDRLRFSLESLRLVFDGKD